MNKKAIFYPVLFFFTLIILSTSFYYLEIVDTTNQGKPEFIGEASVSIVNTIVESEEILTYIDEIARLSIIEGLSRFYENGGLTNTICGQNKNEILNYNVWYKLKDGCSISGKRNYIEGLQPYVQQSFTEFLSNNPYDFNAQYALKVEPGIHFSGTSDKSVVLPIIKDDILVGEYKIDPNFKETIIYDFSHLNELIINTFGVIGDCQRDFDLARQGKLDRQPEDLMLSVCIPDRLKSIIPEIKIEQKENVLFIDYKINDFFFNQPLVIKYSLDLRT